MAEADTKQNGIAINAPLGLNQRNAPNALPPGEWDKLLGCYPARTGLQERIPGNKPIFKVGDSPIWSIHQTNDGSGNVIVQTRDAVHVFTLDQILNRAAAAPNLTYPGTGVVLPGDEEEEVMSLAIILHRENNGNPGGSLNGKHTGSSTAETADAFYTRRLTHVVVNNSTTIVSANVSTAIDSVPAVGSFDLAPGRYRITANLTYNTGDKNVGVVAGLWNEDEGLFQSYHTGTSDTYPILATVGGANQINMNFLVVLDGEFEVTGATKTFMIKHKFTGNDGSTGQAAARNLNACGRKSFSVGTVNGVAVAETYAIIKIMKTA